MSPLLRALEKSESRHLNANKRSVLIITCPEMCQYPQFLEDSAVKDVFYIQNLEYFMLGILDNQELGNLWKNILASIHLGQITDVIFLAHYPCQVLVNINASIGSIDASTPFSLLLSKIKAYMASQIGKDGTVSRQIICQLSETNRQAFKAHPVIEDLRVRGLVNVHNWLFDMEELQTYSCQSSKANLIQLTRI